MYMTVAHDGDVQYGVNEYVCDTKDDLSALPRCLMGSTAIVLEEPVTVYMKDSKGQWVKL